MGYLTAQLLMPDPLHHLCTETLGLPPLSSGPCSPSIAASMFPKRKTQLLVSVHTEPMRDEPTKIFHSFKYPMYK